MKKIILEHEVNGLSVLYATLIDGKVDFDKKDLTDWEYDLHEEYFSKYKDEIEKEFAEDVKVFNEVKKLFSKLGEDMAFLKADEVLRLNKRAHYVGGGADDPCVYCEQLPNENGDCLYCH